MIQLDQVHIQEVRGIRKLTLQMDRKSFAIQGPNGSGKSGVVDAIEFGLTGDITRLSGKGTGGLSVKTHGPHVDAKDYPDSAFVRLKVYLPSIDKTATVTRKVKSPKSVTVEPDEPGVRAVLAEVERHPEITLTRRQIIKFILTEATKRSQDIQALLRLEAIDQTRATLKTASNRTKAALTNAESQRDAAADALRRHLDLPKLLATEVLAVVNKQRVVLGLGELAEFTATTSFTDGMSEDSKESTGPDKESALRDVAAVVERLDAGDSSGVEPVSILLEHVQKLEDEPDLFVALQRRAFVETGLGFVDSDECPLCDKPWDMDDLKEHLKEKLERSKAAEAIEQKVKDAAEQVSREVESARSLAETAAKVAGQLSENETQSLLRGWVEDLAAFKARLETVAGAVSQRSRLAAGWMNLPEKLRAGLTALVKRVTGLPDRSATTKASTFLAVAEERLRVYRQRMREVTTREKASGFARSVYKAYCDASEKVLECLYADVQEAFAESYRTINRDDEGEFQAKLSPSEGKLDLSVDFHKRGLFHPGAYHSEGHQDGMGLCLYLALMRQLLAGDFRLAVLDDVVMSVDNQHRKELCELLKNEFPDTQFVITTHEQAWFHQMRHAGLVGRRSATTFRSWTVEDGPLVSEATDVWEDIEDALAANDIHRAAGRLRRHLEFVSAELADNLVASVPYHPEGEHDLGDLLPAVLSRYKRLLEKALKAARKWKQDDVVTTVEERLETFQVRVKRSDVERWAVNKAVHYNRWEDFVREDFEPVVRAFKEVFECLRCSNPACGSWLYVTPRRASDALRCNCSAVSINIAECYWRSGSALF